MKSIFVNFRISKNVHLDSVCIYKYFNIYNGKTFCIGEFNNFIGINPGNNRQ